MPLKTQEAAQKNRSVLTLIDAAAATATGFSQRHILPDLYKTKCYVLSIILCYTIHNITCTLYRFSVAINATNVRI